MKPTAPNPQSTTRDLHPTICFLGLVFALVGYFGPWVGHRTTALTVTGFELAEFARLVPQVQGGTVGVTRELFLAPLVAVAIMLGIIVHHSGGRPIIRLAATGLTALLALAALPPHEFFLDPPYRRQLALAAGALLLVLLTPLARRLPRRVQSTLVALLPLAGAVPALWQFVLLRPLVVALYNGPLVLGWGLVVCTVGFALLLISGILNIAVSDQQSAVSQPPTANH